MMRDGVVILLMSVAALAHAAEQKATRGRGPRMPIQDSRCNDVPAHPFDLILGRPTTSTITISVLCYQDVEGHIAYGTKPGSLADRTSVRLFKQGEPAEIVLSGLKPDTRYYYQFRSAKQSSREFTFHTARPPGSSFVFTITADSHLDENTDPAIYQQTLANALADNPDFHIDLGDTFMTEKHESRQNAARQYLAQRYYFGQLCHSVPLFLALGNHDGESPRGRGNEADSLAVWSNLMRKRHFPNPVPDRFYTGDAIRHAEAGLLQDYYAWEWGDALFVVLDPFWFTQKQRGQNGGWTRTLGNEQYEWLNRTLKASRAKFRFIFIHHLVGGDAQCRGGVEVAPFFEWGGKNLDGSDGFRPHRPCWDMPIHNLLVRHNVTAVFHGHDHFYARQELDGIIYQLVPQPAHSGSDLVRSASEYGYERGDFVGGSGHLRVTVSPTKVTVAYVRCMLSSDANLAAPRGQVLRCWSAAAEKAKSAIP